MPQQETTELYKARMAVGLPEARFAKARFAKARFAELREGSHDEAL